MKETFRWSNQYGNWSVTVDTRPASEGWEKRLDSLGDGWVQFAIELPNYGDAMIKERMH